MANVRAPPLALLHLAVPVILQQNEGSRPGCGAWRAGVVAWGVLLEANHTIAKTMASFVLVVHTVRRAAPCLHPWPHPCESGW